MAARGALMFFIIDSLHTLDRVYHYSMANFVAILRKGARQQVAEVNCRHMPFCLVNVLPY